MNSLKYFLVTMFLSIGTMISAQDLLVSLSPLLDSEDLELSEDQFDKIVDASGDMMKEYYRSASLYDENLKNVSQKSINQFRSLFTENAKIVNDLYDRLLNDRKADNYASDVMDHLFTEGVKFKMFSASIRDITYDKAGFYKVEVQTQKTLYNGLNFDNSVTRCKTGRVYFLVFTLFVEKDDLSTAKIYKIKGEIKKNCEDASASYGVHLKAGLDLSGGAGFNNNKSPVPSKSIYQDESANFAIEVENIKVFGIGGAYNYPITKKDLLFLSVQFNYELYSLNTRANGTYYFVDENSENQVVFPQGTNNLNYTYRKYVSMDVKESATFHQIELPIGLMYKKKFRKNDRLSIGLYGWLVPGFNVAQNIESSVKGLTYWSNIDFEGADLGINFQDEIGFLPLESFGIGTVNDFSSKDAKIDVKTSFSVRIAPYAQFALNDDKTSFLEVSIEYTQGLSSSVKHNPIDELFLRDQGDDLQDVENEITESLLGNYFEKSALSTLGLRVGFVKQIGR